MLFTVVCNDKVDCVEIRLDNRDDHLAFLGNLGNAVKLGGPMMDPSATVMNGSMLVIEAKDLETAREMMAGDPYAKAGLFESVDIRPWKWTVNSPA